MKKIYFFVIMYFSVLFIYAQTENDFEVTLTTDNTGAVITRYKGGAIAQLRIPDHIQGFPVKEIGSFVFQNNYNINSVILPYAIKKIGDEAFYGCRNLTTVIIPSNVESIEFVTRSARSPSGGYYNTANFGGCNLNLSSMAALKQRSYHENFTSKSIGDYSVTLTNDYTGLIITSFRHTRNSFDVSIPGNLEGMPVKEIGRGSFVRQLMWGDESNGRLLIPEGVEIIRQNAFGGGDKNFGSNFTSIIMPNTLRIIEKEAFSLCRRLTNVIIPEGVTTIGDNAFNQCENLTNITIPSTVTIIGNNAFSRLRNLTQVNINSSTNSNDRIIGNGVFSFCDRLVTIIIPEGIIEIGEGAFSNCSSLSSVVLPSSLMRIGNNAFINTRLPLSTQAELRRKGYTGNF